MEELVEIVNQLQEVFSVGVSINIDLPQIVVIGAQSSGKSSVLEHIVGKSFLPRGSDIVTRCPLVLQMVKDPEEYAVFGHSTKRFTDNEDIRKEIEDQTNRLAGENKGICHTPIFLKMYSPSLINLTLVDLPGFTKIPVGDQPDDIEQQIERLTLKFIENPKSLILAVSAANVDLANSESLKVAKSVDKYGERTIAVLTKVDLMDQGTDAWDMLNGKIISVKLGIVGVVNRSQKDIIANKGIKKSLEDEAKFFRTNYQSIAAKHGTSYLSQIVQSILLYHIQKCMPELKEKISKTLKSKKSDLSHHAKPNDVHSPNFVLNLLFEFTNIYVSAIKGGRLHIQTEYLYGGALINSFLLRFTEEIRHIDSLTGLQDTDIHTAITNAYGMNPAMFVPEDAFEPLAKRQVEHFRSPSVQCVKSVHQQLMSIAQSSLDDKRLQLHQYPKIKSILWKTVQDLLNARLPITSEAVETLIDIQIAHISTSNPDFLLQHQQKVSLHTNQNKSQINELNLSMEIPEGANQEKDSLDRGTFYCALLTMWLKLYISGVCKIIEDTVPKMIVHVLVNFVIKELQAELVNQVSKENTDTLLSEPPNIVERRNELEEEITKLEQADNILNTLSTKIISSTVCKELKRNGDSNLSSKDEASVSYSECPEDGIIENYSDDMN